MTGRMLGAAAFAAGILLLLRGFGACSDENQAMGGAKSDAGTDSQPEAAPEAPADSGPDHAPPPWDPVWHETKPATFTVVAPGPRRERPCGAPCKVIAETKPAVSANRRPRATDDWAVFQVVPGGRVHAARLDTGVEVIVDDGKGWPQGFAAGLISVWDDYVLYAVVTGWGGLVVVRSLLTGEAKVAWSWEDIEGLWNSPYTTAFAKPFAYWEYGPQSMIYRFDLRDGALKSVPTGGCLILEGTSTGLASCSGEGFTEIIDFDAGKTKKLGSSPYEDNTGGLSPDGKSAAWIDQRDPGPNGEIGNWFKPFGGEVYIKNMITGVETRVTFDSPGHPVMKAFPRLVEGRLAWHSWMAAQPENPDDSFAWQIQAPTWYSIDGSPPAPLMDPAINVGYPQPIKTGVVGEWSAPVDGGSNEGYLVHVAWPKGTDTGDDGGANGP